MLCFLHYVKGRPIAIKIESIADHLDLVDTIARWHWEEWGHLDPEGSLRSWTEGLRRRVKRDSVPTTYVAMDGEELFGSVTLVEHDMSIHQELSPRIAGVYVKPERGGQGVATALMRHAVAQAAQDGNRAPVPVHRQRPGAI